MISGTNYGYLLFPPFEYDQLTQDILQSLQTFATNRKLEGLIVDERIAGSSSNWPLEGLLALFQDGKVGEFYNSAKQKQEVNVKGQDTLGSQTIPLIVLVGQNTVGFPEIFAASLQASHRAKIVGAATPGSIETASAFYLPDGSRIFIETTSFRLPNGDEIGNSGVKPNVTIEAGWDQVIPNADPVLDKAIELIGEQK